VALKAPPGETHNGRSRRGTARRPRSWPTRRNHTQFRGRNGAGNWRNPAGPGLLRSRICVNPLPMAARPGLPVLLVGWAGPAHGQAPSSTCGRWLHPASTLTPADSAWSQSPAPHPHRGGVLERSMTAVAANSSTLGDHPPSCRTVASPAASAELADGQVPIGNSANCCRPISPAAAPRCEDLRDLLQKHRSRSRWLDVLQRYRPRQLTLDLGLASCLGAPACAGPMGAGAKPGAAAAAAVPVNSGATAPIAVIALQRPTRPRAIQPGRGPPPLNRSPTWRFWGASHQASVPACCDAWSGGQRRQFAWMAEGCHSADWPVLLMGAPRQ